jgi:hypothetical protein
MGFLRLADLFPEAPAPSRAEPESGVHPTSKKKRKPKERARVPVLEGSPREIRAATEDARARWIAPFIDGTSTLDEVIAASALDADDARVGVEILVAAGLVRLVSRAR